MCVRGRRPRERLNSPKDKPKTSADGSRHGLKASPSPRHRSASWHGVGVGGRSLVELSTQRRVLFQASEKEGERSRQNCQERAYSDGPQNSSWRGGSEERSKVVGGPSRSEDYFSGKPLNERVRAPGWRVASMASSCGRPPCSPHWLLEDTPKKHARQVNAGCSPRRRSCGYVLAPVPVRGATSKPLCNPTDPGASEPQSIHRRVAAAATAAQGARRGESPGLAPVPFLPAPG